MEQCNMMDGPGSDIVGGVSQGQMTPKHSNGSSNSHKSHHHRNKNSDQRKMVDITRDKPIKVAVRVVVPVRDHPKFNFVGKLLGPKGNSLKRLQEDTMCKMAVLGRGSMKDRHKEEELRASGDPKFQHLSEDLHVEISAFATPAEAHARIAYALAEVRRFLVPDYNDDIRQEQMWEMQVLSNQKTATNGTNVPINGGGGDDVGPSVPPNGPVGGILMPHPTDPNSLQHISDDCSIQQHHGILQQQPMMQQGNQIEVLGMSQTSPSTSQTSGTTTCSSGSITPPDDQQHPAMRGAVNGATQGGSQAGGVINGAGGINMIGPAGGGIITPVINVNQGAVMGRKRPLVVGGSRTSMTPTKRTVMSLLARARAAQAKQLPATFQRAATERTTTLVPLLAEDYIANAVNLNII